MKLRRAQWSISCPFFWLLCFRRSTARFLFLIFSEASMSAIIVWSGLVTHPSLAEVSRGVSDTKSCVVCPQLKALSISRVLCGPPLFSSTTFRDTRPIFWNWGSFSSKHDLARKTLTDLFMLPAHSFSSQLGSSLLRRCYRESLFSISTCSLCLPL